MAANFKMGSIADIVNSSADKKSPKKNKKQLKNNKAVVAKVEEPAEAEIVQVKPEKVKKQSAKKVAAESQPETASLTVAASGKKRKINDSVKVEEPAEAEIAQAKPQKMKKQSAKKEAAETASPTTTAAAGKKRKINDSEKATEDSVPVKAKKSSNKRKKQRNNKRKKTNSTSEAAAEDSTEEKDEDSKENKADTEKVRLEKLTRTVFVGNLPANFSLKNLKKVFSEFGTVASIRIRAVAPGKPSLSKKAALLSKQINPNKKTVNAYVVFRVVDSVEKALTLNGTEIEGNIIQVDKVQENAEYQSNLSVFLGNLSFKLTDNELREFFKDCGEIASVRLIRDSKTGIGKGFGYVTFANKDGVVLALEKDGQTVNGREIRVKIYHYNQKTKTPAQIERDNARKNNKKANVESDQKPTVAVKKPKKKDLPVSKAEFKGEVTSKKTLVKKSLKSRIKSSKLNKQKKQIAEILSK